MQYLYQLICITIWDKDDLYKKSLRRSLDVITRMYCFSRSKNLDALTQAMGILSYWYDIKNLFIFRNKLIICNLIQFN